MRQMENTCHGHDCTLKMCLQFACIQFSVNNSLEIPSYMQVIASYESIYFRFHKPNTLFCKYVLYYLSVEVTL